MRQALKVHEEPQVKKVVLDAMARLVNAVTGVLLVLLDPPGTEGRAAHKDHPVPLVESDKGAKNQRENLETLVRPVLRVQKVS